MVNKIIAFDKEIELNVPRESFENNDEIISVISDYNPELGDSLRNTPFRYETEGENLVLYRTDAHFG
jgi:hypothetical protein